ncbi:hypothetical protein Tco_0628991 [Tanacetum coccineum]|uniref:Uncharacterized protein n=1 Tax=Tanacetum coccineum TaxID=301880 RepID=A0ABQ4WRU8_9ASTR
MVISSQCLTDIKNWLVQNQTAFGKDFSNPFTTDSLITNNESHSPCFDIKELASPSKRLCNEALAILEQTATGKEISNLFMAGSLPKTT